MIQSANHQSEKLVRIDVSEHFPRVQLVAPTTSGYLLMAAEVDRRPWQLIPFSRNKNDLIRETKAYCAMIGRLAGILSASAFRAFFTPPGGHGGYLLRRKKRSHRARFDIVVLIEADSLSNIEEILRSPQWRQLESNVRSKARYVEVISATNAKRIADVDHTRDGVFLFNFFEADDVQQNLNVWEYTAGWFQKETELDNSTVLLPDATANTTYSIINHCRWDRLRDVLPSLLFKRSFRNYVLAHFDANDTAAMPILYHLS
jgi:hypothetical protein